MEQPVFTFAERLEELKAMRGFNNSDLARICNVDKANITRYCRGDYKAKQDVIYRMAQKLGIDEAWLMGYDVPMSKKPVTKSDGIDNSQNFISEKDKRFLEWFHSLSQEKQKAILISQDAPEDLL